MIKQEIVNPVIRHVQLVLVPWRVIVQLAIQLNFEQLILVLAPATLVIMTQEFQYAM